VCAHTCLQCKDLLGLFLHTCRQGISQELVNISNISPAKRKERENHGDNGTRSDDIIESSAKIACLDLNLNFA